MSRETKIEILFLFLLIGVVFVICNLSSLSTMTRTLASGLMITIYLMVALTRSPEMRWKDKQIARKGHLSS